MNKLIDYVDLIVENNTYAKAGIFRDLVPPVLYFLVVSVNA